MVIKQGDIFWVELGEPSGSGPAYRHPHLVIQNNVFNSSRINTVIVCSLTSNLRSARAPGNVLLEKDEANLTKQSVVNVTQVFTVDKRDLTEKMGSLSGKRMAQVLEGIELVIKPKDIKE
ncbi:MAG: type II toxin-antitoxin system PemK/MazF family toxin [Chloroflexi bacterium]|nr:type II toxin-antitoxin system PemK/MazF family toxin [Chloroflexota bacterium]